MAEQIFVKKGDTLEPVDEQPFELEDDLQELLAKHPRLLGNARRWLLVTREKGVADAPDGADRWSLDHLFVDQDAVPTLVEVKRGSNSQIRREVVGQMLDYAANGSQFWTSDEIREAFERECAGSGEPADAVLQEFLGEEDSTADEFWSKVATNLAARQMRLVFVADAIPLELIRVVEFLNAQMRDVEVLAVEIKQFKGDNQTETLVSRVIGDAAAPPGKNAPARTRTRVTMEEFLARLPDDRIREATQRLMAVARESGAMVSQGAQSLSIRVKVRDEVFRYPVTVAWLYPDGFEFGASRYEGYEPGPIEELRSALNDWSGRFDFGEPFQSAVLGGVEGSRFSHAVTVEHIADLEDGLADVIEKLHAL